MNDKTLRLMRMRKNEEVRVREKKWEKRNKMRKEEDEENGSREKRK